MELTFYGGVNEIGGNKILLEEDDTKVFLDFGMSFGRYRKFFEEYMKPRVPCGMGDFMTMGLVPRIEGIYRRDLLQMLGLPIHEEPMVDAVVLSHMHLDHSAYISFLDERIPVYCTEISKRISKVLLEAGTRQIDKEIYNFKCRPIINKRAAPIERRFEVFEPGESFNIGSIEIHPFAVSHSIPGAVAFVIYCPNSIVAYTGDLRLKGPDGRTTEIFVEEAGEEPPDILLCEGTMIDTTESRTEDYVKQDSNEMLSRVEQLVIVDYADRDLARFKTFYQIALENDRKLMISKRDAYLLQELSSIGLEIPRIDSEDILIYIDSKGTGRYVDSDYRSWERQYLSKPNAVKRDFVHENQGELIVHLGFYDINELIDMRPNPGSIYIHSTSEPHNEEQWIDMHRLENWLESFNIPLLHIHASGHANGLDLAQMIQGIQPKKLMPIHTEKPELFQLMHHNIEYPELFHV